MKKKVFSKLLMVALVATVGVFSSCKDYDDDISDVNGRITQTATELRTDYTNKISAVNTAVEKLQTQYDQLTDAYKKADEALKATLETSISDNLAVAKAYTDAAKGEALNAATAAEQAAKAYADIQRAEAEKAALAAAKEQVAAAKQELTEALAKANQTIAEQGTTIESLLQSVKTLDAGISAAQARANEAYALADKANTLAEQNKTNLEKAAADIATLQTELANLKGSAADKADVAKLQSDLAALQDQVNKNVVNLADYKENITKLTSDLATLKEDLAKQVSILGESIAAVKQTADANVAKIEGINTQLAELKEANTQAHEQIIASVNALAQTVEANKGAAADALKAAVEGIEAKLAAAQKLIETNDAAIRALVDTKASELKALIDGNTSSIVKNAQDIAKNAEAQAAENVLMNNAIAKNAQDIIAQGKDITSLEKAVDALKTALGDDTAATLKEYAASIAKSEALQAKLDAQGYSDAQDAAQNITIMAAIAQQAKQDKEAWEGAISTAVDALVKTYQLNALAETIKNAQLDAEANAKKYTDTKAQELSDKALADAKHYTDDLKTFLTTTYTNTEGMNAAIEAAKQSAIAQAYKNVMDALFADNTDWTKEGKVITIAEEVAKQLKAFAEAAGYTNAEAAEKIAWDAIEAALIPSAPAEIGKPAVEAGPIMAAIEAAAKVAADELAEVNTNLDARIAPIEAFLGETLGDGEAFKATVNALIADAKLASAADLTALQNQVDGYKVPEMQTALAAVEAQAATNASDVKKIQTTINNINGMFSSLFATSEATSNVDDNALKTFEDNIQALVERINKVKEVTDNLDDKVMESVNKNLGPQIQGMITEIHLFANQHMAERDQQYKLAKYNSETNEFEYPFGWENFDHTLTFCYAVEQGIFASCKYDIEETGSKAEWNYPEDLLAQIKAVKSDRDELEWDYDYEYEEGGFTGDATKPDFIHGRYRTWSDSILVRVSPTNADLSKAEIALLNSKGEDIIAAGLVEKVAVSKYAGEYITRFEMENTGYRGQWSRETRAAEGNETGLWVIKFKLEEDQIAEKFEKYAHSNGGDIVYAVAVKNTDFSTETTEDVDRYVVSEYDLSLALEKADHAYDFTVNTHPIDSIHNRYITPEQGEIADYNWDDDPVNYTGSFRYELTWHQMNCPDEEAGEGEGEGGEGAAQPDPIKYWYYAYCWNCCYDKFGYPKEDCKSETSQWGQEAFASSTILFKGDMDNYTDVEQKGVNTCDRHGHSFDNQGVREMSGTDNRHLKKALSVAFDYEMDGAKWAKIDIKFPVVDNCGRLTPIRGFFVTLDQHFALESDNSEINAWTDYEYKNVAKYSYNNGKKDNRKTNKIHLFESNEGSIYIKDANNIQDGDVIGFRVHAVNLDGTITDPDGRAFYVMIGSKQTDHKLSFNILADTLESYAVQNKTVGGDENAAVDNEAGLNPIATFNENMTAAKKSIRFFNNEPYSAQYDPNELIFVQYTWREGNPAIRSINKFGTDADSKNAVAVWPVAGTGNLLTPDASGNKKPMIKYSADGDPVVAAKYGPETFFDFWYSLNPDATAEDNDDNKWVSFNKAQPDNKGYAPNKQTKSMRASIKKGMANHLIDGETYKITMTIKRLDSKTGYVTVNTYDIDITKDMPTGMPEAFGIKSLQLTDGNLKFFVRPYAGVDFEYEAAAGGNSRVTRAPVATDPWKITWKDFVIDPVNADNFKKLFDADKYVDKNGEEKDIELHNYRWAMDTRMYNLEGIFDGLYVDEIGADGKKTGKKTIDKNYILQFDGVGSYAGALSAQAKDGVVKADADNANGNALSVYNEEYDITIVNPDQLAHKKGAYTLPLIHWSHLGETKTVSAGYIYRDISATLVDGKFLVPAATKAGKAGLSITNDDYEIAIQPIKVGNNQLTATYICALYQAISPTADTKVYTVKYNEEVTAETNKYKFALSSDIWEAGSSNQAYFNTKFDASWKKSGAGTLKEWLAKPWTWLDVKSLKVKEANFTISSYYDDPTFMVGTEVFDPEKHTFDKIDGIQMLRSARSQGLNDLKTDLTGKFSFDIYDIWFHKKTIDLSFKVTKPENGNTVNARQAK